MKKSSVNKIIVDHIICDFCGACSGICPENCIELPHENLIVDHKSCTRCGFCVQICPVSALFLERNE